MTVQEVAARYEIPISTVYRWASRGVVPAKNVAPKHSRRPQYKLLRSDVEAYLARIEAERQRPRA